MKPVVFVDIDGVLNSSRNYLNWHDVLEKDPTTGTISMADDPHVDLLFDQENIGILNEITDSSGAIIVISSSWRQLYRRDTSILVDIFKRNGVSAKILGTTPTWEHDRASAISIWLYQDAKQSGDVRPYVILDDFGPEMFRGSGIHEEHVLTDHLVQTDAKTGLVWADVRKALRILGLEFQEEGFEED